MSMFVGLETDDETGLGFSKAEEEEEGGRKEHRFADRFGMKVEDGAAGYP